MKIKYILYLMFQDLKTMVEPATNQQTDEELSTNQTTDDELPTNQTTDDELPTNQHTEDLLTEKGGATSLQTEDGPTTCLSETDQNVSTDSSLPGIKVFGIIKFKVNFLIESIKTSTSSVASVSLDCPLFLCPLGFLQCLFR